MWSFDNPDLVDDVWNWSLETPNVYYVGAGLLVVVAMLLACICCCCRRCCCPSWTQVSADQSVPDHKET